MIPSSEEQEQRARVVAEARSWLGTKYLACADIKGAGVDCGMLIVRCFVDIGLCSPFDPRPYTQDWHLHRSEEIYLGFVGDRCARVDTPLPGDVALVRYGRCYSHGAIVTVADPLRLIHAFQPAGRVMEEDLARTPLLNEGARKILFFSFWASK